VGGDDGELAVLVKHPQEISPMHPMLPRFMEGDFESSEAFARGTDEERATALDLARDGVAVIDPQLPDFDALAETVVRETSRRLPGPGRLQDAWREIAAVRQVAVHAHVLQLLAFAYGRRPVPFQTLNFTVGTQQKTHSDTVHFDCFPRHFMCGVWLAYEDADTGNGALHYVPGSHRLPVMALEDFGIPGSTYRTRTEISKRYEQALDGYVARMQLPRRVIPLRKGQALIWAANVFHGGEPIQQPGRTRHSQVTHYYFDKCLYTQPLWSDLHGGRVMYKKVFDLSTQRYVQPWYNGRPFKLPLEAHLREFLVARLIGVRRS
jgi:hypothetical protein